ncbi:winged helix-turn-helix domain-containing protein [Pelagibacteraceae bacterium]|nr:winged helix-turn-helix domain-containing protein [Pelagibacteraceae bacterium]
MHKINVLSLGSKNFNTSLEELKDHLNFKLITINNSLDIKISNGYDVLFVHQDYLKESFIIKFLKKNDKIKILASSTKNHNPEIFTDNLLLPTFIKDINSIIENSVVKKSFNKSSSIKIKDYILDKNEKKLIKNNIYISLTEKEIQLLELFIKNNKATNKDKILNEVWKYAADADTHTVETHIYRLRKKVKHKFADENFILNDKKGYLI